MSNRHTPAAVVAAILDDYRAGRTIPAIAERHGVSERTIHRHTLKAGLRQPRHTPRVRPRTTCQTCGKSCRASTRTCRACILADQESAEAELTDGRWVRRGLTYVWVADAVVVAGSEWRQFERAA